MTALEILKKHCGSPDRIKDMMYSEISRNIRNAMEEYAEEVAIEFRDWTENSAYKKIGAFYANQNPVAGKQTFFTTKELFAQFKNEKGLS